MKCINNETTYQLTTLPGIFPVNVFIIEEANSLTLIDTGIEESAADIIHRIEQFEKKLETIIITHSHSDHIGSLAQLKNSYPDAKVMMSKKEYQMSLAPIDEQQAKYQTTGAPVLPLPVQLDQLVEDGDQIGSLTVIETPGHTPGSISLLDHRTNHLFVGDLFQTHGGHGIAGDIQPLFPLPGKSTWDFEEAINSTEKICTYQATIVATAHGEWLTVPNEELTAMIEVAQHKLAKKRKAI
ncbi:MBL fold metallo-hydrolase [Isobaculum melis]|uniref:Glyoxylase, beta-lactamase superfamily II n=1 Tax=Isobaculum melis TaxID=142588 RepID=A0A1H9QJ99_9LACT|nr:MBL fold metallo-hydrolase [Isobaculum melis]SER60508.1 Glyoxylase, beta-lactamase superfamily II [Isobaculum melis]